MIFLGTDQLEETSDIPMNPGTWMQADIAIFRTGRPAQMLAEESERRIVAQHCRIHDVHTDLFPAHDQTLMYTTRT